jgi:FkbM family methyltransferase
LDSPSSTAFEEQAIVAPKPKPKTGFLFRLASRVPHAWLIRIAGLQYRFPFLKPALQALSRNFRNRDAIMQNGIGRGLKFNTAGSIAGYALGNSEPDLQTALKLLVQPGMTVYDIGANVGFFSVLLARLVGPRGQVYAFEPVPANARQIEYNARLNGFSNITVDTAAMGDAEGTAAFRVSDFSTTGKLRSTGTVEILKEEIPVSTRQLDTLVYRSGLMAPSLLKIDAEGAEVAILKGGEKLLATARPIFLIELHSTQAEVTAILERHGYSIHVLGSPKAPRDAEWNCRIVAAPRELDGFDALIPALTDPALMR